MSRLSKISNFLSTKSKRQDVSQWLIDVDKDLQQLYSALKNYIEVSTLGIDNNTNAHIKLTGDPTNSSSSDGEIWFDGTNLKINIGGTVYNLDKSAA